MKTKQCLLKVIARSVLAAIYFAIAVFLTINVKSLPASRKGLAFFILSLASLWVSIELSNMRALVGAIAIYRRRK